MIVKNKFGYECYSSEKHTIAKKKTVLLLYCTKYGLAVVKTLLHLLAGDMRQITFKRDYPHLSSLNKQIFDTANEKTFWFQIIEIIPKRKKRKISEIKALTIFPLISST